MSTKTGFIGFYDILGYQNLMEKNDPEYVTKTVLNHLSSIGKDIPTSILRLIPEYKEGEGEKILRKVDFFVFSDSILMTLETSKEFTEIQLQVFLIASILLQSSMFKKGLPLRGVINFGDYYLDKSKGFAGKPIIEAYQVCQSLELAACVITEKARSGVQPYFSSSSSFMKEYPIPTKIGNIRMMTIIAHTYKWDRPESEMRSFIFRSFNAHKKDVDISVQKKIDNTEEFLKTIREWDTLSEEKL